MRLLWSPPLFYLACEAYVNPKHKNTKPKTLIVSLPAFSHVLFSLRFGACQVHAASTEPFLSVLL